MKKIIFFGRMWINHLTYRHQAGLIIVGIIDIRKYKENTLKRKEIYGKWTSELKNRRRKVRSTWVPCAVVGRRYKYNGRSLAPACRQQDKANPTFWIPAKNRNDLGRSDLNKPIHWNLSYSPKHWHPCDRVPSPTHQVSDYSVAVSVSFRSFKNICQKRKDGEIKYALSSLVCILQSLSVCLTLSLSIYKYIYTFSF